MVRSISGMTHEATGHTPRTWGLRRACALLALVWIAFWAVTSIQACCTPIARASGGSPNATLDRGSLLAGDTHAGPCTHFGQHDRQHQDHCLLFLGVNARLSVVSSDLLQWTSDIRVAVAATFALPRANRNLAFERVRQHPTDPSFATPLYLRIQRLLI